MPRDGRAIDQGRKESRRKRITCDKHRDKSLDTELGIRASCVTDMQQVASNGVTPVSHRSANGEPPRIKSFLNVLTIAVRLLFGPIQTEVWRAINFFLVGFLSREIESNYQFRLRILFRVVGILVSNLLGPITRKYL